MLRAAHDLANMLTVTLGHCELAESHPDPVGARTHATKARVAAQRCVDLVHSVFAAARNTTAAYDLNVVVEELAESIEGANMLPAETGITLDLLLEREIGATRVLGDSMGMARVLLNLVLNARDAMEKGGVLTITTLGADATGWVRIEVKDTGKGMSADQLAQIWEPHVSADRRHGYGLTIVKSMLDQAKGKIVVTSVAGLGTIFTILLKAA